jgi:hypothetical protein
VVSPMPVQYRYSASRNIIKNMIINISI